jgi:hypothetical protein
VVLNAAEVEDSPAYSRYYYQGTAANDAEG